MAKVSLSHNSILGIDIGSEKFMLSREAMLSMQYVTAFARELLKTSTIRFLIVNRLHYLF